MTTDDACLEFNPPITCEMSTMPPGTWCTLCQDRYHHRNGEPTMTTIVDAIKTFLRNMAQPVRRLADLLDPPGTVEPPPTTATSDPLRWFVAHFVEGDTALLMKNHPVISMMLKHALYFADELDRGENLSTPEGRADRRHRDAENMKAIRDMLAKQSMTLQVPPGLDLGRAAMGDLADRLRIGHPDV